MDSGLRLNDEFEHFSSANKCFAKASGCLKWIKPYIAADETQRQYRVLIKGFRQP